MDHYGLIGNPVSHSLSEKYFTDKFTLEAIDARFERFLLKDITSLPHILDAYPELKGLSVTSPFKEAVLPYCDKLGETAKKIKAVNTLKIDHHNGVKSIMGFNTDVDGFAAALLPIINESKVEALILGSGGAARAVAFALNKLGINYKVVSRSEGAGKIIYEQVDAPIMNSHKLIINATPLGMGKFIGLCPRLPYQHLTNKHTLFDLIYNPVETPFLAVGKKYNTRMENGLIMLQAQAEQAWNIWKA